MTETEGRAFVLALIGQAIAEASATSGPRKSWMTCATATGESSPATGRRGKARRRH